MIFEGKRQFVYLVAILDIVKILYQPIGMKMASDRGLVTMGVYVQSHVGFHMMTLKFTLDDLSWSKW